MNDNQVGSGSSNEKDKKVADEKGAGERSPGEKSGRDEQGGKDGAVLKDINDSNKKDGK